MQGALNAAPVYHSTGHAFASLARAEGLPGFYRGFGAILLGFAPAQVQYKCLTPAIMGVQLIWLRTHMTYALPAVTGNLLWRV
jgi:hypothetical protein